MTSDELNVAADHWQAFAIEEARRFAQAANRDQVAQMIAASFEISEHLRLAAWSALPKGGAHA